MEGGDMPLPAGSVFPGPGDNWWTFTEPEGWDGFAVQIQVQVIGGLRCATGLRLEPVGDPRPITGKDLRTFPLAEMVEVTAGMGFDLDTKRVRKAQDQIRERAAAKSAPDPRAITTVEEVAAVWNAAYSRGDRNKRGQVCEALNITARTADRYLRRAREQGLLADSTAGD